jgi:hypothetical protein
MKHLILVMALVGCDASIGGADPRQVSPAPDVPGQVGVPTTPNQGSVAPDPVTPTDPTRPTTATTPTGPMTPPSPAGACAAGRDYTGFGGESLRGDRKPDALGRETRRPKAFGALLTEYPRVLGNTPAMLAGTETTFGALPARWFAEATVSGVSIYTAFRVAFQGCLALTAQSANYNTFPTDGSARAECASWAERFWSRRATGLELDSCVKAMVQDAASEASARRRWAYGCATTLTAADFLTF